MVWKRTLGVAVLSTMFSSTSRGQVPVGSEFLVPMLSGPHVAQAPNGSFVVIGQGAYPGELVGIRYDGAGAPVGGQFQIAASQATNPTIHTDAAGNFAVVWVTQDGDGYGIACRRYASSGSSLGPAFRVNSYTTFAQTAGAMTMESDGRFVVAWQSRRSAVSSRTDVFAQRFASDGSLEGGEFRVNTSTGYSTAGPLLAADSSGNFLVVWSFGSTVYAQRFDSSGALSGSETPLPVPSAQVLGSSAAGSFVVGTQHVDEDSLGVFARRFSTSSSPLGAEFRVNSYTTLLQMSPAIALDGKGDFVLTWQSQRQDDDGGISFGIYGQGYSSDGLPSGAEFHVNTYVTSSQESPSIAMTPTGSFIIVWQSYAGPSGPGVYGQRYGCVPLTSTSISVAGETTLCPDGQGGTASVADVGGGFPSHFWGYRTSSGGMTTLINGAVGPTYVLKGADFPGPASYYLVCITSPSCGVSATTNEVLVSIVDSDAPVVIGPAAAAVTQSLCQ